MAINVKETLVMTRPNANTLWPHEAITSQNIEDPSNLFTTEKTVSEDGLTETRVRYWTNNSIFVSEKSKSTTVTANKEYFNYIVNNNITIVRTYETY